MKLNISFEIKIVFDNKCPNPGFIPSFGFSALIYSQFTGNFSLFDTGGNGNILIHNIKQFGVDISEIKKVIISHNHHDHAGGLERLLRINPNIEIYIPLDNLKSYIKKFPQYKVHGISNLMEIEKNLIVSGQIKGNFISEQSLFLKTINNEIILLVGCSHPGLERFIIKAKELANIKAIIGGFHGFRKFSYLENIDFIGACHCTQHKELIKKNFPNQFKHVCLGDNFSF